MISPPQFPSLPSGETPIVSVLVFGLRGYLTLPYYLQCLLLLQVPWIMCRQGYVDYYWRKERGGSGHGPLL